MTQQRGMTTFSQWQPTKRTYSLLAGKMMMTIVSNDPHRNLQLWHRGKIYKNDRVTFTKELIGMSSARPFHMRIDWHQEHPAAQSVEPIIRLKKSPEAIQIPNQKLIERWKIYQRRRRQKPGPKYWISIDLHTFEYLERAMNKETCSRWKLQPNCVGEACAAVYIPHPRVPIATWRQSNLVNLQILQRSPNATNITNYLTQS